MSATKQILPKGWKSAQLGELGNISDGDWILNRNYSDSGVRLLQVGDIGAGRFIGKSSRFISHDTARELNCTLLEKDDLLISRMPDPIGRACLLPDLGYDTITAVDVSIWRPKVDWVDKNFLLLYMCSEEWFTKVLSHASGATRARISRKTLETLLIPFPSLEEQKRISSHLEEKFRHIEQARQGIEEQLGLLTNLVNSYFRESLQRKTTKMHLSDCMVEVKKGVGETWAQYPVLGATRAGVAPAKEKVGKQPQRYKLVEPGTIFYNPMRIMIGSIAMLDDGDESGITSPDYVVLKGKEGILHPRWFYYWFRSPYGENFIKSLARGAVRERMLFNRLDKGEIELPDWETQVKIAEKLKEIKTFRQALESQLAEINELPSALLRQAFAGEL